MQQEKIISPPPKRIENPDANMEDAFSEFICGHGFTADQVRQAYEHLLDRSAPAETAPEVTAIHAEMQRLEQEHFPLSRIASIIGTFQRLEDAVPTYLHFVLRLPITDGEKAMLRSLVQGSTGRKDGELVMIIGGQSACTLEVRSSDDIGTVASEITDTLKQAIARAEPHQPITFSFTERFERG